MHTDRQLDEIAIRPGDIGYAEASSTYMARGHPAVVLRVRDSADIAAGIRAATDASAVLTVRSGGHSALHATNTDGIVIDVSAINSVEVLDPSAGLVRVGAGARWIDVAEALGPYGLALTSGDTTSVGVGGLTLGGGIGWLVRLHGLTIDSLRAVDIVTADGSTLRASADAHPDLFWAVRGGGGNFGVVTHFEFAAERLRGVVGGMLAFAPGDTAAMLAGWRDAMRSAPEQLSTAIALMPGFGDMPAGVVVFAVYAGDDVDEAQGAIEPLRKIGTVVSDTIAAQAYAEVLEEAHPPPGVRAVADNTLVRNLSDDTIDATAALYGEGQRGRVVFLRSLGGAVARVPAEATAFAHRDAEAMIVSAAFLPADASDADVVAAREPWHEVARHGMGSYVNFMSSDDEADVAAAYPAPTYQRLAAVKCTYDPANVFNQNFNIQPG